jgi:hypothetical protein
MYGQKLAFISVIFLVIIMTELLCGVIYSIFGYHKFDKVNKKFERCYAGLERFLYFFLIWIMIKAIITISYMYY